MPLKWKNTVKLTNIHFPRYEGTIKLAYLVYNYVKIYVCYDCSYFEGSTWFVERLAAHQFNDEYRELLVTGGRDGDGDTLYGGVRHLELPVPLLRAGRGVGAGVQV